MRTLIRLLGCSIIIACGPTGGGGADGGTDAGDGGSPTDSSNPDVMSMDSGADTSVNDAGTTTSAQCVAELTGVIDSGCTRCWPAARVMCTEGNPSAVVGLLQCLTGSMMCWDVGDFNTAAPCMQNVISTYGDSNVTAAGAAIMANPSCGTSSGLIVEAIAVEMSPADRAAFATCLEQIPTDAGCGSNSAYQSCLAMTHYNTSLCMN